MQNCAYYHCYLNIRNLYFSFFILYFYSPSGFIFLWEYMDFYSYINIYSSIWVFRWPGSNDDKNQCVTKIFRGPVVWLRGAHSLMRQQMYFGDDLERGVWTLPELSITPTVGGVWLMVDVTLTGMIQWRGAGTYVSQINTISDPNNESELYFQVLFSSGLSCKNI